MKKIGPLSLDLIVACKLYELRKQSKTGIEFKKIVAELDGIVGRSTVLNALNTLSDWGIVKTEYGETDAGRAGRFYYVSGEAEAMIKETYENYWDMVMKEVKKGNVG